MSSHASPHTPEATHPRQPEAAAMRARGFRRKRLSREGDGAAGENIADKALCRVLVPATGLDQVNGQISYLVGRIARIGVEVDVLAEDERVGCFADSRYLVRP
jgi:hypothetical protein